MTINRSGLHAEQLLIFCQLHLQMLSHLDLNTTPDPSRFPACEDEGLGSSIIATHLASEGHVWREQGQRRAQPPAQHITRDACDGLVLDQAMEGSLVVMPVRHIRSVRAPVFWVIVCWSCFFP